MRRQVRLAISPELVLRALGVPESLRAVVPVMFYVTVEHDALDEVADDESTPPAMLVAYSDPEHPFPYVGFNIMYADGRETDPIPIV